MSKGLFITVNYRKDDLTIGLLENFERLHCDGILDVVVADNVEEESDESKLESFVREFKSFPARLIKTGGNLGYFGAASFVLNQFKEFASKYDYVVIANNDVEIKDTEFFNKVSSLCNKCAVIAPDIISTETGRHQNPHRIRPITRWQKIQYQLYFLNYYSGLIFYFSRQVQRYFESFSKEKKIRGEKAIFSAHGAFMVLTRHYFFGGGKIDAGYFLYGEEDSVAAQCHDLRLTILFCPTLVVYHHEHQTTRSLGFKKMLYDLQKKAYEYIKSHYRDMY